MTIWGQNLKIKISTIVLIPTSVHAVRKKKMRYLRPAVPKMLSKYNDDTYLLKFFVMTQTTPNLH